MYANHVSAYQYPINFDANAITKWRSNRFMVYASDLADLQRLVKFQDGPRIYIT